MKNINKKIGLYIQLIFISSCFFYSPMAYANSVNETERISIEIYTSPTIEKIDWYLHYLDENRRKVKKTSRNFEIFKKEFIKMNFSKNNRIKIDKVWDNPNSCYTVTNVLLNNSILEFIRKEGYQDSTYRYFHNKHPNGLHIIYGYSTNRIEMKSTIIINKRLVSSTRSFLSISDFEEKISNNIIHKNANIWITYWAAYQESIKTTSSIKKLLISLGHTNITLETAN